MTPSSRGVFFSRKGRVRSLILSAGLLPMAFAATNARAQGSCDGTWVPTMGPSGVDGTVYAMAKWDPDGPGPLPEGVLMGGSFSVAGTVAAAGIAWWNPQAGDFMAFGSGMNGAITAVGVLPDGRVIAGGSFTTAGSVAAKGVAVWDGSQWSALGGGIDDSPLNDPYPTKVRAVAGLPDGSILVGGNFSSADGTHTGSIAKWNGQTWSALGGTPIEYATNSLLFHPTTHELFIGTYAGTYRWNGELQSLGGPAAFYSSFDDGGTLYASNKFLGYSIAAWSGSWSTLINGYFLTYGSLLGGDPGHLSYVRDRYTAAGTAGLDRVYVDLSSTATPLHFDMDSSIRCLLRLDPTTLLVGGSFASSGSLQQLIYSQYPYYVPSGITGQPAIVSDGQLSPLSPNRALAQARKIIQRSDGSIFSIDSGRLGMSVLLPDGTSARVQLPTPINQGARFQYVVGLTALQDGSVAAIQGGTIYHLNNEGWQPLGTDRNLFSTYDLVAMTGLPNGDLVVASVFLRQIDSTPVHTFARWNGQYWTDMCSQVSFGSSGLGELSLSVAPNGDLIVAGDVLSIDNVPVHGVARWDGTAWHDVGDPGLRSPGRTLAVRSNGNIVMSGNLATGPYPGASVICEWNGAAWSNIPAPVTQGTSSGFISGLAARPNGDIIAGGDFDTIGGTPAVNIARWDGAAWHPIGEGLIGDRLSDLITAPDGSIYAAGTFSHSGNTVSYGIAHAIFTGNPPTITQQPVATTRCTGYPASFAVQASSAGSLSYRWTAGGVPIDIATNPSAATNFLQIPGGTGYESDTFRCIVSNGCDSITSDPATLNLAACCPDYNLDGNVDAADIDTLFALMGAGDNPYGTDPDFNHDGNADQDDIDSLINVVAGGDCP